MITSKQNDKIKAVRSLKDKKYRDELGLFVIEGVKLVKEAISLGVNVVDIFCTENGSLNFPELKDQVVLVSDEVFKSMSYEVTPQGVLCTAIKPTNKPQKATGNCLLLDCVSDPSNVGALIRTCACSGYNEVYTVNCGDPYSAKAVRSSMGGIFRVKIYDGSLEDVLSVIDYPIVVADMNGVEMSQLKIDQRFCLVIGNEGHGVSKVLKEKATYTVSIPMENGMESLNASVSGGILMYALKK